MPNDLLGTAFTSDRYPRSSKYDPQWIVDNLMGPHPLWQAEALISVMPLRPGSRVLDLGCGTALTSIFLAREYDVEVWATDLWVDPTENWERIQASGAAEQVHPMHADATKLPFSHGFFGAIVSIGSYHYFGTGAHYLTYCADFLRPDGSIGIVVPGIDHTPGTPYPSHLIENWDPAFPTWLDPAAWRALWTDSHLVAVDTADTIPNSWQDWLTWLEACALVDKGHIPSENLLRADQVTHLGLTRIAAHRV
jgi:cyclopropane fatty-acyl-phospholipid synthase-like methyltransferase